jgi:H/ACA ribonucleoprotein complex subunit 4
MGLGKGTRITHSLLKAGKEYVCEMDVHEPVEEARLVTLFESYEGVIEQLPPVRSAVKREPRERSIYYLDILDVQGRHVLFRVGCEAGTYIRKLCHDIGDDLGVGAHMAELRRTKVGPFTEDAASTLQDVEDAVYVWQEDNAEAPLQRILTPVERGVEHLKKVWVFDTAVNSLCHGASLKMPGISKLHEDIKEGDYVAVMTLKDELIETGFAQATSDEMLNQDRGVAVKPKQVYMRPGTYPKS